VSHYEIIKNALEEHYCSHPEFVRGPNGAETCPPLDAALASLETLRGALEQIENLYPADAKESFGIAHRALT
jgi:hypothetical protein